MSYDQDLLTFMILKESLYKRPNPVGDIGIVLSPGNTIDEPIIFKPLPF